MILMAREREVYGSKKLYPTNEVARLFARVAGTKTLTDVTLDAAEKLGFEIRIDNGISNWREVFT